MTSCELATPITGERSAGNWRPKNRNCCRKTSQFGPFLWSLVAADVLVKRQAPLGLLRLVVDLS